MSVDPLLTETVDRFLGEHCTHAAIQQAEADGSAPELWRAFAAHGFAGISIPESAGGSGGTVADALEVLRLVGFHAAPIPAAEHSLLAGWALAEAGLEVPGLATAVPHPRESTLHGDNSITATLSRVPWARDADRVVLVFRDNVVSVPLAGPGVTVIPQVSLAGEPRDTVILDRAPAEVALAGLDPRDIELRGALARAAMVGGALDRMVRLTVSYTNEREQFGRPVARFQAVQQHLVWAAQQSAVASMAADQAGRAAARAAATHHLATATFEIASAKLIANQAATIATRACHQAHGAMGMTQEYPLHHLSRRLWSWRKEYGGSSHWARRVGELAVDRGPNGLYPLITKPSEEPDAFDPT